MISEQPWTKERTIGQEDGSYTVQRYSFVTVTYEVLYIGDTYFEDDILGLTEEQKKLSADYRDSLDQLFIWLHL